MFSRVHKTWNASRVYCQNLTGDYDLVTVSSQAEHNFLKGQVNSPMWIGLHDIAYEGNYSWADGSLSNFGKNLSGVPWCPGEPNNRVFTMFEFVYIHFYNVNHV